jgi:hypothetical protein
LWVIAVGVFSNRSATAKKTTKLLIDVRADKKKVQRDVNSGGFFATMGALNTTLLILERIKKIGSQ